MLAPAIVPIRSAPPNPLRSPESANRGADRRLRRTCLAIANDSLEPDLLRGFSPPSRRTAFPGGVPYSAYPPAENSINFPFVVPGLSSSPWKYAESAARGGNLSMRKLLSGVTCRNPTANAEFDLMMANFEKPTTSCRQLALAPWKAQSPGEPARPRFRRLCVAGAGSNAMWMDLGNDAQPVRRPPSCRVDRRTSHPDGGRDERPRGREKCCAGGSFASLSAPG
jgi:hypothetical protein